MIDCSNDSSNDLGRAQPRQLMDLTFVYRSVFSEAFFVGVDAHVTIEMDFSGIARSVCLDLIAINPSCCRFSRWSNVASSTAGRTKLRIFW